MVIRWQVYFDVRRRPAFLASLRMDFAGSCCHVLLSIESTQPQQCVFLYVRLFVLQFSHTGIKYTNRETYLLGSTSVVKIRERPVDGAPPLPRGTACDRRRDHRMQPIADSKMMSDEVHNPGNGPTDRRPERPTRRRSLPSELSGPTTPWRQGRDEIQLQNSSGTPAFIELR